MGNVYVPAPPEKNPAPPSAPKHGRWGGPHLHFDVLGGRNNQNQRG